MNTFNKLIIAALLILAAGCGGKETGSPEASGAVGSPASASSTAPTAVTGSPGASASSARQSAAPKGQTASRPPQSSPAVSQTAGPIAGKKLEDQSFNTKFENMGDAEFITTVEKVNGKDRPHFYLKKGETLSELNFELDSPDSFYSVSAVSFQDVSGDGKKDIIVIADYTTGAGYMGAIPVSQVVIFKQNGAGFTEDKELKEKAHAGIPYRILTIQDVITGLKTDSKDSLESAWKRVKPGAYKLDSSNDLSGSTLTIEKTSGDGVTFSIDAFYAASKEAMDKGGVNIGTIESGQAALTSDEMLFKDGDYHLTLHLISATEIYLRDDGEGYYGHNVDVNGIYSIAN
jgi:hypothetical protein